MLTKFGSNIAKAIVLGLLVWSFCALSLVELAHRTSLSLIPAVANRSCGFDDEERLNHQYAAYEVGNC